MTRAVATAKINLALVVGPRRADGKHDVTTVLQRVALADHVTLEPASSLIVDGFAEDTIVRNALERLAADANVEPRWRVRLRKRIPIAAGLGGGSSDAATALRLANATLREPRSHGRVHELARDLGADVPFFLTDGPQLGEGDGSSLTPLDLPQDYLVLLALPRGDAKTSTESVYAAFDERDGASGHDERRVGLLAALDRVRRPRDLAALPPNDLATSPLADDLHALGAFRADVSGAGPVVYALFHHRARAEQAVRALRDRAQLWLTTPAWYG